MNPEELKYNPSHEWVGLTEEDGQKIAVVGITDFALEQLTDLVFIAFPAVGSSVTYGEEFGEVESVKAVSPMYSPVSGEVIAVHEELADDLEQLPQDAFGNGWIMKVKMTDDELPSELLDRDQYLQQCADS